MSTPTTAGPAPSWSAYGAASASGTTYQPTSHASSTSTRRRGSPAIDLTTLNAYTAAAHRADSVRPYTRTANATLASWSPSTDSTSATHRNRNSRTRNGFTGPSCRRPAAKTVGCPLTAGRRQFTGMIVGTIIGRRR